MSPHDTPTETLVEQAQQGDRDALDELCQRHRPRLLRMIRCRLDPRLQTRVDESDLAQESLALASRDLAAYQRREGVPFYAWLRQIAWRQLLRASEQHIKTDKRTVLREQPMGIGHSRPALAAALADASTPSQKAVQAELTTRIAAALDALPDASREVLVLRFMERLSTAEAAAVQGISPVALRGRLTRALKRIGELLKDEWPASAEEVIDESNLQS